MGEAGGGGKLSHPLLPCRGATEKLNQKEAMAQWPPTKYVIGHTRRVTELSATTDLFNS